MADLLTCDGGDGYVERMNSARGALRDIERAVYAHGDLSSLDATQLLLLLRDTRELLAYSVGYIGGRAGERVSS